MNTLDNLKECTSAICEKCKHNNTEQCSYRKCSIGFAKYLINKIGDQVVYPVQDGESLIPENDFKYYEEADIAKGIAHTCRLCRNCNENHTENCNIALIRRSFEYTQFEEKIEYPGNVILYLLNVSRQKPELAALIKEEYSVQEG